MDMNNLLVGSKRDYLKKFRFDFNFYQENYVENHPESVGQSAEEDLSTILDSSLGNNRPDYSCDLIGKFLRGLRQTNFVSVLLNQSLISFGRGTGHNIRVKFIYGKYLNLDEMTPRHWDALGIVPDEATSVIQDMTITTNPDPVHFPFDNNSNPESFVANNNNIISSSSSFDSNNNAERYASININNISSSNSSSNNSSLSSSTINNINSLYNFTGNNNPLEIEKIVCFGRWAEYEMLYSYMTRILNDTNNKSIAVTPKVEIRVNIELLRTALHAIACTGYISNDDKSHKSNTDKEHRCCSYCYEEIAGTHSSIKQRMIELRKLSVQVTTKEGRLTHRGGLDRDHGNFTDRKLESYPDSIKNLMIQGMAEDLQDSDHKELLKMSSRIGATKIASLSSSLLTSSPRCNITVAKPIVNSLPQVFETVVIDAIILPIRIVSKNKAPEPFIKIAPSKPLINNNSTQAVTSAITSEDLIFWSQIAKGNDPIPPTVTANISSSTSASVDQSVAKDRDIGGETATKGNQQIRLRTPDEFFRGRVSKPKKIVRASLLDLVDGMRDTAEQIMTVIEILVEDDPILAKTKFFSTIICTASDLSLKANSIERGGGLPPKKNYNPPYDKRVIKHYLDLFRKVGPSGYRRLRSYVTSIPSQTIMSFWDIYFNGSTNVTGVCYELINQFAINVIELQKEMVQASISCPGDTFTSLPEPPTENELQYPWLLHVLYDETYIKKAYRMKFQKKKVDGGVDGNSMGAIYKNSSASTDKQVLEEIMAKTVSCYFMETQWGSISNGSLCLAATFGSNNETCAGVIEQLSSVTIALITTGFIVISYCFDCAGINRATQKAFCTKTDVDGRPSNRSPDFIYTTGCKSDYEVTSCPCEGHGIKNLRSQWAKFGCTILDFDGGPLPLRWDILRKFAEQFQKDAGRFEANKEVYMKMFTVMDNNVTKMEVRAAEEILTTTTRSFISDVCDYVLKNLSDDQSALDFLQSMESFLPLLELFDRGQIFLKGMNLNLHDMEKNRGCMTKLNDNNARRLNFLNCDPERKVVSEILEKLEMINAGVLAHGEQFIAKITLDNLVSLFKSRIELIDTVTRPDGQAPYAELRLEKVRESTAEYVFGWAKSKYPNKKFTKSNLHEALRTIFGQKAMDLRDYILRGLKSDDRFLDHHFVDRGAVQGSNCMVQEYNTDRNAKGIDGGILNEGSEKENKGVQKRTIQKGNTGLNDHCRKVLHDSNDSNKKQKKQ